MEERLYKHIDMYVGLGVTGAVEDLDRLPVQRLDGGAQAAPANVVVDRLPPTALVNFGIVASGLLGGGLDIAVHVQNALNSHHYIADPDFERRQAILPMAAPGLSATLSLTWRM